MTDPIVVCGTCKHLSSGMGACCAGHELKFPLMVETHDCPDHVYNAAGDRVQETPFNRPEFSYCGVCSHCYAGVCSGKHWIPFKTEPRCEFFVSKDKACRHSEPVIQYGNGLRNNRCLLKDTHCPMAHVENGLDCYKPLSGAPSESR